MMMPEDAIAWYSTCSTWHVWNSGTFELKPAPVDIPALLRNVAEKFAPQAQAAGVSINVDLPALPVYSGDGDRLAQVFTNLVDNALKIHFCRGQCQPASRIVRNLRTCPVQTVKSRWKWQITVQELTRQPDHTYLSGFTRLTCPDQVARSTGPAWVWQL